MKRVKKLSVLMLMTLVINIFSGIALFTEVKAATTIKINFQPLAAVIPSGYIADGGETYGNKNGYTYGWTASHTDVTRERGANSDQKLDTLINMHSGAEWKIAVSNGLYDVTVSVGDPSGNSTNSINVEGVNFVSSYILSSGNFGNVTKTVEITDGVLNLNNGSAGEQATRINYIEIVEKSSSTPTPVPTQFSAKINYQPLTAQIPSGYIVDGGETYGSRNGYTYGWTTSHTDVTRDRGANSDQRLDTLINIHSSAEWKISVPNGYYDVTVSVGDPSGSSTNTINIEGVNFFNSYSLGSGSFGNMTKNLQVTDGVINLNNGAAGEQATRINYIEIISSGSPSTPTPTPTPSSMQTKTFNEIPVTNTTEIVNPMRGWYSRMGNMPMADNEFEEDYKRYEWRDLEKYNSTTGQWEYDFSKIITDMNNAKSKGHRFAFRVRSMVSTYTAKTGEVEPVPLVPKYVADGMANDWSFVMGGKNVFVPDWNDPLYMEKAEALIQRLGESFGNEPCISWIDIGMYGDWGEFHMQGFKYPKTGNVEPITYENGKKLIDAYVKAFPNKQLVFRTSNEWLDYVVKTYPHIGYRTDALGDLVVDNEFKRITNMGTVASDRWKIAPYIGEPIYPLPVKTAGQTTPMVDENMVRQVPQYHISNINNLNFQTWSNYPTAQQDNFKYAGRLSGYRYAVRQIQYPGTVTQGTSFSINANWINNGSAPAYLPWDVTYQLRDKTTDQVVWKDVSSLNLKTLFPSATVTSVTDTFKLPSTVVPGQYNLVVRVEDQTGFTNVVEAYQYLGLAIEGIRADGSYMVGPVQVNSGTGMSATAPVAVINTVPTGAKTWETIEFRGDDSYDPNGYISKYQWEITLGSTYSRKLNGAVQSLVLRDTGTYTVKLTVWDNQSNSSYTTVQMSVAAGNAPVLEPRPTAAPGVDTFNAVADTYVQDGTIGSTDPSNAYNKNFDYDWTLMVKDGVSGYNRETYLKFDLSSLSATNCSSAKLKLFVYSIKEETPTKIRVYGVNGSNGSVDPDAWSESTLTWKGTENYVKTTAYTEVTMVDSYKIYEFDVTQLVGPELGGNKIVTLCLTGVADENREVKFDSSQAVRPPVLEVVTN